MSEDGKPDSGLVQRWYHSHEEDIPGGKVFRPEDYPLPPSRGRESIDIKPDGSVLRQRITPDDRSAGAGQVFGKLYTPDHGNPEIKTTDKVIELEKVAPDKLIVKY